jgi:uncharacterized protein YdhG (YjbR/CyaY superfamily)
MRKGGVRSVDEYVKAQPKPVQAILRRVRDTIRKALPAAEEVISYQIPAYKLHGRVAIYFAGWRGHYSLYPTTAPLVAALGDALSGYELSNKGTIRFPLDEPVPVRLIARIAKFRAREVEERAVARREATRAGPRRRRRRPGGTS